MHIQRLSNRRFLSTIFWATVASGSFVAAAALLGRGILNLNAALIEKPDLAIYLLLEDEGITDAETLRETEGQRDYLVTTASGQFVVKLRKGETEWYVAERERMHP